MLPGSTLKASRALPCFNECVEIRAVDQKPLEVPAMGTWKPDAADKTLSQPAPYDPGAHVEIGGRGPKSQEARPRNRPQIGHRRSWNPHGWRGRRESTGLSGHCAALRWR